MSLDEAHRDSHEEELEESTTTGSSSSIIPPLFSQTNVRKPEYWQFAKLIAPQVELPEGKKTWTTDDAIGIWCLRCNRALNYQKGSSQSIRYHMETKHLKELHHFRSGSSDKKDELVVGRKITGKRTAPSEELLSSATMQQRVVDTFKSTPSTANTTTATTSAPTVSASPLGSSSLQTHNISSTATSSISIATWKKNLERRGGFWGNAYWYDAQLLRRLPLAKPMLEEMIAALPPCDGKRVLDLCSGSGRAACALLKAYPTAKVTLFDSSDERLAIARKRFAENDMLTNARFYSAIVNCTMFQLAESPYDLILGALALHVIVEQPQHYYQNDQSNHLSAQEPALLLSVEERYEKLFEILYNSLRPGGHLIFGDHVGQLPLYQQLKLMEKVGFTDVDCAWRQNDFFAAGGMKPNATNSQDLSAL